MIIRTDRQREEYQEAIHLSMEILKTLHRLVEVGITPMDIENESRKLIKQNGAAPAFLGVGPRNNRYEHSMCISVNDTVVHGIPNDNKFKQGDIVKLDFGLIYNGYYTDHCVTVGLKDISKDKISFIQSGKEAVLEAVSKAIVGNRVGDIGHAMDFHARKNGYKTVREFTGHGIGKTLHDDPMIPSYGSPHTGTKLEEGMILCIESQIVEGDNRVYCEDDGWTYKTSDHSNVVMFEYMVLVQKEAPIILTDTRDWDILV